MNAGWLWNSSPEFIGTLNRATGVVARGSYRATLHSVRREVGAWGTTGDWASWFAANNLDTTSPTSLNIVANGLGLNRSDRAEIVSDMQEVAQIGADFYLAGPLCAQPKDLCLAGSVRVDDNACVPNTYYRPAKQVVTPSGIDAAELKLSGTVENQMGKVVQHGPFKGELANPYTNSRLTMQEIMSAKPPIPDPQGVPGALRWDMPGGFRGANGTWELVVDPKTNTVLHFKFTTKP